MNHLVNPRFPTLSRENALDCTSETYHTAHAVFHNQSVVDTVVSMVSNHNMPSRNIINKLTEILEVFPEVMYAFHDSRRVWYYVCKSGRRDLIEWVLDHKIRNFGKRSVLPALDIDMDVNGNSILMSFCVYPELLRLMFERDLYVMMVKLLCFINKKDGNNLLHFHAERGAESCVPHVFSLIANIMFESMDRSDLVVEYFNLPDANAMNKSLCTPLQLAVGRDNPKGAMFLIAFYGAFWFHHCPTTAPPSKVSYRIMAKCLGSTACVKVLDFAKEEYEIVGNVDSSALAEDIICTVCTEKATATVDAADKDWYRLDCGHHLHCHCLMGVCSSGAKLACPECRRPFNDYLLKKSPPTLLRWVNVKSEHEEEMYMNCKTRMETALRNIKSNRGVVNDSAGANTATDTDTDTTHTIGEELISRLASAGKLVGKMLQGPAPAVPFPAPLSFLQQPQPQPPSSASVSTSTPTAPGQAPALPFPAPLSFLQEPQPQPPSSASTSTPTAPAQAPALPSPAPLSFLQEPQPQPPSSVSVSTSTPTAPAQAPTIPLPAPLSFLQQPQPQPPSSASASTSTATAPAQAPTIPLPAPLSFLQPIVLPHTSVVLHDNMEDEGVMRIPTTPYNLRPNPTPSRKASGSNSSANRRHLRTRGGGIVTEYGSHRIHTPDPSRGDNVADTATVAATAAEVATPSTSNNGRNVRRRIILTEYGISHSSRTRLLFEEVVDVVRKQNGERDARRRGQIRNDRCVIELLTAAIAVNTTFTCESNNFDRLDLRGIATAAQETLPTYEAMFGDPRNVAFPSQRGREDTFQINCIQFERAMQFDSRMNCMCVPWEDLASFQTSKLHRLLEYVYGVLILGMRDFNPRSFSKAVGILMYDVFNKTPGREALHNNPDTGAHLADTIGGFMFTVIVNAYRTNCMYWMRACIDEANSFDRELVVAMEDRWNRLYNVQNAVRGKIKLNKLRLTLYVHSLCGVCKTGVDSLVDLMIAVCNTII